MILLSVRLRHGPAVASVIVLIVIGCSSTSPPGADDRVTEGATPAQTATATATADLVIHGGPILTMNPQEPRAEAIAVRADHIVAVGSEDEVMSLVGLESVIVDLAGAALIPGFVDAHSHFFSTPEAAGTLIDGISDHILSLGITTTAELWVDEALLAEMERVAAEGDLHVRVSAYLGANNSCGELRDDWWAEHPPLRRPGDMLRVGGVKIYSDGGACNTPAVSFDYVGGGSGDLYFTADELAVLITRIEAAGHQAAVHALGDRAIETVLDALGQVIGDSGNPNRHRIDHTAATRPDLRGRHGEVGAVSVISGAYQTCFFTGAGGEFNFRTPPEYLEWEWPWRDLLEASPGAHFAWHADFPVFPSSSPIDALYGFVTRSQVDGDGSVCEPTDSIAAGAITVEEALQLMTTGSAYALFRDGEVGRIAPDMLADLVVLSADPTAVPPQQLTDLEVWMTMVGGSVGWCAEGHEAVCPAPTTQPASG